MDKKFGGVIWTNHALQRMSERGIKQSDAWAVWRNPDESGYSTKKGAWVYKKYLGQKKIEVVAKKNEKGEWLIISVWSKPLGIKSTKKKSLITLFVDNIRSVFTS